MWAGFYETLQAKPLHNANEVLVIPSVFIKMLTIQKNAHINIYFLFKMRLYSMFPT